MIHLKELSMDDTLWAFSNEFIFKTGPKGEYSHVLGQKYSAAQEWSTSNYVWFSGEHAKQNF